jgi:hypothetical protein
MLLENKIRGRCVINVSQIPELLRASDAFRRMNWQEAKNCS